MQKREKMMMGAAGGAAVFFIINQFLCSEAPKAGASKAKRVVSAAATTPSPGEAQTSAKSAAARISGNRSPRMLREGDEPLVRFAVWKSDPFHGALPFISTAADSARDSTALTLRGIAWKHGDGLVLIGDEILRKGETRGNLEVLDIREDRVLCRVDGEIVTYMLRSDSYYETDH